MMKLTAFGLFWSTLAAVTQAQDECPKVWKCQPTTTAPTLDAELDEWASVVGIETPLKDPIRGTEYDAGSSTFKCMYDATKIYFAMSFPGFYKFSTEDNHFCAAIATMTKIGADATYYNMGGCPDAMPGDVCNATTVEMCDAHRVDIGAHWELRTTEQGVEYTVGLVNDDATTGSATQAQEWIPTGDDAIANKDDEYGVSPYCRFDDNDDMAGNEWAGAWKHTNPTEGELGSYIFEMSRLLTTRSTLSDAQMKAGDTVDFGIAFWDPLETDEGWTDAGHYVTGCGHSWIQLELVVNDVNDVNDDTNKDVPTPPSTGFMTPTTSALFMATVSVMVALVF